MSSAPQSPYAPYAPYALTDKTALITGGGSGLGFAIAKCFVASGAKVIIVGQNEDRLKDASDELGAEVSYQVCNINSADQVETLVKTVKDSFGSLDILVNNAGNHIKRSYEDMSLEDFNAVLNTHVAAAFNLTKSCLPLMREAGGGNILFMASMASYLSVPNIIGYTAAKSAVLGLVRGTAAELSGANIRSNGIAPGWIKSPMTEKALGNDPERLNKILARTPMGKMGDPEDIGWAAAFLCSPAAKFINGHTLVVDGGAVNGF